MSTDLKQQDLKAEVASLRLQVAELTDGLAAVMAFLQMHPAEFGTGRKQFLPETPRELDVPPWKHLVWRKHPWRRQLSIRGRSLTVRQLTGTVTANRWNEEEAATNLDLPPEAIREALTYAEENQHLLDYESACERMLLPRKGADRVTRPLP